MIRNSLFALVLGTLGVLLPPALPESPFAARVDAAQHTYQVLASNPRHGGITATARRVTQSQAQAITWKNQLAMHYRTVKIVERSGR
jgi:hypothetical protein